MSIFFAPGAALRKPASRPVSRPGPTLSAWGGRPAKGSPVARRGGLTASCHAVFARRGVRLRRPGGTHVRRVQMGWAITSSSRREGGQSKSWSRWPRERGSCRRRWEAGAAARCRDRVWPALLRSSRRTRPLGRACKAEPEKVKKEGLAATRCGTTHRLRAHGRSAMGPRETGLSPGCSSRPLGPSQDSLQEK
jgi:hypothetical protein